MVNNDYSQFTVFWIIAFPLKDWKGVFESHQTCSTESLMRMRWTVTHSAGTGIYARLNQKHFWARCNLKGQASLW